MSVRIFCIISANKKLVGKTHLPSHNDVSVPEIQTQKGSNERLFILTRTHSIQIFGEFSNSRGIPQNLVLEC